MLQNGSEHNLEISLIDKLCGYYTTSQSTIASLGSKENTDGISKVESIVRAIPGYYSNGPWKQLGGFFGPYLNEETYQLREDIPEKSEQ